MNRSKNDRVLEYLSIQLNVQPRFTRFIIARMLYELNLKRRLNQIEQKRIFDKCSNKNWFIKESI